MCCLGIRALVADWQLAPAGFLLAPVAARNTSDSGQRASAHAHRGRLHRHAELLVRRIDL